MAADQFTVSLQELQELANFWSEEGDALSLYFQSPIPSELGHREEPILVKENIQQKLRTIQGISSADREDIRRILESIAGMRGDHPRRTRIIFACGRRKLWREFDIPGNFGIRLDVDSALTLGPLLAQQQTRKRYCIALADRNRARLLLLEGGEIHEHSHVLDEDKEKIRTTGTGANNNLERNKEEKVKRHYKFLSDHLLHFHLHRDYDLLIIACRDDTWPDIEATLHPELKRILVGRFSIDPGMATGEDIAEKAQAFIQEKDRRDEESLVEKVTGAAASDGLGAIGLDAVIGALERGEVRTLLWAAPRQLVSASQPRGSALPAPGPSPRSASLCPNCGHLDGTPARACTLCGTAMRHFARAEEALLRHAVGRNIEVRMLTCAKLPPPDAIAAWLRFLARHNTAHALAS